jgi:hypothetical protein
MAYYTVRSKSCLGAHFDETKGIITWIVQLDVINLIWQTKFNESVWTLVISNIGKWKFSIKVWRFDLADKGRIMTSRWNDHKIILLRRGRAIWTKFSFPESRFLRSNKLGLNGTVKGFWQLIMVNVIGRLKSESFLLISPEVFVWFSLVIHWQAAIVVSVWKSWGLTDLDEMKRFFGLMKHHPTN